MKKLNIVICLSLMTIILCSFTMAQQQLNQVWLVGPSYASSSAAGSLWSTSSAIAFIDTAFNIRGIDVSTTEGKVLVVNKAGGGNGVIYVANTLDGQTTGNGYQHIGSLDTTVILATSSTGATYTMDKVKVAADGSIYVCNLSLGITGTANLVIYRWASTTSAGTISVFTSGITAIVAGARVGDGMGIAGSGTSTQIYVSGSGTQAILKFTTSNGTTFTLNSIITTAAAGIGGNDMTPVAPGGNIWASGPSNSQPTQLVTQAGITIDTVNTGVIASSQPAARYFTAFGHQYILKGTGNIGTVPSTGYLVDVTNGGANAFIVATTASFGGSVANTNGTGDAAVDANNNLYFMNTNSGYGKFNVSLTVSPTSIVTKPNAAGTVITASWGLAPYTWSLSGGHGSISTTAGSSITYTPGITAGTDTVTLTDSALSSVKVIITTTPTSAPMATESDSAIIQSKPIWKFME